MTIILDSTDTEEHQATIRFLGELWDDAEVVECNATLQLPSVDARVQYAMNCLNQENVLRKKYDHAWIMHLIDESIIKELKPFYSENSYRGYMHELGIEGVAGVSTLNQYYNTVSGSFPNWTFSDTTDNFERLRRVNVAWRFCSAFTEGKTKLSENFSEK